MPSAPRGNLFVLKTPFSAKKIQKHEILPYKKRLFSLSVQNEEIPYKNSWFRNFFVRNSLFLGYLRQTNLRVTEIVVLKSTQKGLPAPDSDASYNCGFSKGKWPSASHHNRAAYRRHPWRQSANANIVFALPLRLNHFPRKSHSLRRIYVQGSSPFLLVYEKHPNYLGRAF